LLHLLPLDLHVLGTPPAFNLSQDQTLQLIHFNTEAFEFLNSHLFTNEQLVVFGNSSSIAPQCMTRVPTQVTYSIF
jgi:hypothetical protein